MNRNYIIAVIGVLVILLGVSFYFYFVPKPGTLEARDEDEFIRLLKDIEVSRLPSFLERNRRWISPKLVDVLVERADLALERDYDEARNLCDLTDVINGYLLQPAAKRDLDAHCLLVKAQLVEESLDPGALQQALKYAKLALDAFSQDPINLTGLIEARNTLSGIYGLQDDLEQAELEAEQALNFAKKADYRKGWAQAHLHLASIAYHKHQYDKAEDHL